ncbi:MAG: endonuclease/exonuclease/phosphatase family protein [Bacteroidales bacterium]|jgi:endonuclease/exonuclease/phosphatase family metal-dependent hydrolase|nr:endonuclease/exonuclease/phosphatase family protein [Bacteroidales bacterium]
MYKLVYFSLIILLACSCKESSGEIKHLEVSADEMVFWPEASSKTVSVSGSSAFTATLAEFSDPSWCTVEIIPDKAGNLKVSVTDNEQIRQERNTRIVVGAEGADNKFITVRQTGAEPALSVKETQIVVNENVRLTFSLEITSNIPVSFDLPEWITLASGNPQTTGRQICFFEMVPLAAAEPERTGSITVRAQDHAAFDNSVTVPVRQSKTTGVLAMSYNVRNGVGMDGKTDYQRIANVITAADPDVVALQELDSVTVRSNFTDVLSRLSELTAMHAVYGASIPFNGGKYGIGVLSKEQPLTWKRIPLPGREELRSLLIVEFSAYVFCCTHFSLTEADRKTSVAIINEAVRLYDKPVLLAGDINDTPESPVLKALRENWEILSDHRQFTATSDAPSATIDYILGYTSEKFTCSVRQAFVISTLASDHLPIVADILIGWK